MRGIDCVFIIYLNTCKFFAEWFKFDKITGNQHSIGEKYLKPVKITKIRVVQTDFVDVELNICYCGAPGVYSVIHNAIYDIVAESIIYYRPEFHCYLNISEIAHSSTIDLPSLVSWRSTTLQMQLITQLFIICVKHINTITLFIHCNRYKTTKTTRFHDNFYTL